MVKEYSTKRKVGPLCLILQIYSLIFFLFELKPTVLFNLKKIKKNTNFHFLPSIIYKPPVGINLLRYLNRFLKSSLWIKCSVNINMFLSSHLCAEVCRWR